MPPGTSAVPGQEDWRPGAEVILCQDTRAGFTANSLHYRIQPFFLLFEVLFLIDFIESFWYF